MAGRSASGRWSGHSVSNDTGFDWCHGGIMRLLPLSTAPDGSPTKNGICCETPPCTGRPAIERLGITPHPRTVLSMRKPLSKASQTRCLEIILDLFQAQPPWNRRPDEKDEEEDA